MAAVLRPPGFAPDRAERHNEEVPRARDDGQACMRHVTAEDDGRACGRRECERGREPVLLVVFMERLALDDFAAIPVLPPWYVVADPPRRRSLRPKPPNTVACRLNLKFGYIFIGVNGSRRVLTGRVARVGACR